MIVLCVRTQGAAFEASAGSWRGFSGLAAAYHRRQPEQLPQAMIVRETLAPLEDMYSEDSIGLRKAARQEWSIVALKDKGRHVYASGRLPG